MRGATRNLFRFERRNGRAARDANRPFHGRIGFRGAALTKAAPCRVPCMHQPAARLVDSKSSWVVATVCVLPPAPAVWAPWMSAVALKDIAAEVGGARSVPALATALAWFGSALGRRGIRRGCGRRGGG